MKRILYKLSPVRNALERELKKLIPEFNKEGIKILEIGCGPKSYKTLFPKTKWIATDIEKTKYVDEIADVTKLKYKKESFDVVFCLSVLEHVFEYDKAVSEMHRVLKKNGVLILSTPFIFPLHDKPNDFWRFTEFSLKKILRKFKNSEIKGIAKPWHKTPMSYFVVAKK